MSASTSRCWLIIPAAGKGSRMESNQAKQYLPLLGQPMLAQTLQPFLDCEFISGVTVALAADDTAHQNISALKHPKVSLCTGGASRAESVLAGLRSLVAVQPNDWVMVHDAARPCVSSVQLQRLYEQLKTTEHGGLWAIPQPDTLKRVVNNTVVTTVDRSDIWCAQTPQMFRFAELNKALSQALKENKVITDEASAIEALGLPVKVVLGHSQNIKVTYPEDAALAAYYLQNREE